LWQALMDEMFFFLYHLHVKKQDFMQLTIAERKYFIDKFIDQKTKEREEQEKAFRSARSK
jgi:hypothetical protein